MSFLTLRNSLGDGVATAIPTIDIAYENQTFNPNDADGDETMRSVDKFVGVFFIPATVEALGKQKPSDDDMRGVYQVSIFVKLNANDYDNTQLQIADDLRSFFFIGAEVGEAFIESAELTQGGSEDGWFKRDLSINYISYQTR